MTPNNDQYAALAWIDQWAADIHGDLRFMSLSGAAGTGKSCTVKILKDALAQGGPVYYTATTGKAARRLSEAADVEAVTLHSLLYRTPDTAAQAVKFETVKTALPGIVVVDEASMITPGVYEDMQAWAEAGTRFLLVGDPYQLPPIMSPDEEKTFGADFTVFSEVNGAVLTEVMRSDDEITALATQIRTTGQLPTQSRGAYEFRRAPVRTATRDWMDDQDDHVLITWRNKLRMRANRAIRTMLKRTSELPDVGEPILFCRNGQGVLNGEVGVTHEIMTGPKLAEMQTHEMIYTEPGAADDEWANRRGRVRVSTTGRDDPMDGSLPWVKDWGKYRAAINKQRESDPVPEGRKQAPACEPVPITWAYVLSGHKSQGSQWRRVTVFLSDWDAASGPMSRQTALPDGGRWPFAMRWLYTAVTRAESRVTVIVGPE